MRRLVLAIFILAACGCASLAHAQIPGLIDRPSPPPCAADGMCYPNTEAWGYYQGRWRTWPGVGLEPTPSTAEPPPADLGPELTPHETPPPELEDKQAPPATTKRQPTPLPLQPAEEGSETDTPPPQMPSTSPTGLPTSDADPPPAFPLSLMTHTHSPVRNAGSPGLRTDASQATASDPPPAPPWNHRASL